MRSCSLSSRWAETTARAGLLATGVAGASAGPRTIELPGAHTLDSVRGISLATLDYGETQLDSRYWVALASDRVAVQVRHVQLELCGQ